MHHKLRVLGVILVLQAGFATSGRAQRSPSMEQSLDVTPVLAQLHVMDELVIRAAELAMQRARDADIRAFAGRLRRDHRFMERHVEALGDQFQIDLDDAGGRMMRDARADTLSTRPLLVALIGLNDQLPRLRALRGQGFDRLFVELMASVHEAAVQELAKPDAPTSAPQVLRLLSNEVPILREHVQLARTLEHAQE